MTTLPHLFQPLKVGRTQLANRFAMSCMAGGLSLDKYGYPDERMIAYYEERAKASPGMMGIGAGTVNRPIDDHRRTEKKVYSVVLYDDGCIAPLQKFTERIRKYGTKFGIQLWDGGIQSGGLIQHTPSGVGSPFKSVGDQREKSELKILSVADIAEIVGNFATAAERCAQAGFDFVEIHAGHGYLISAFLTPHFNRRTDQYGGSLENRLRFLVEILRAVKARVGDRMIVGVKINGSDYLPKDGWTVADAVWAGPVLEREGADYLSMTAGVVGSPRLTVPPLYEPQACYLEGAEEVKKVVKIPVSIVGRIKNPVMADELIRDGKVDLVAMGRPMIADPEIVAKAREGRLEDIRPCLADCRGCLDHQMRTIMHGETPGTSCIVNPRVHREAECIDIPGSRQDRPRTIVVVGAGVAGLEAARRAAFSGHKVILCDKRARVGGQVRWAEKIPGRHEIGDILPWYETQLRKLNVDVRLNTTVNEALLESLKPHVVVVASGSVSTVPQSLTTSLYNIENIAVVMADDLFEEEPDLGDHVLVLGGEQNGLQIADYIASKGKKVVVAEETGHFASKMAANDRWYLTHRIIAAGVARHKNVQAVDIESPDQVYLITDQGRVHVPNIDTLVLASLRQSDRSVAEIAEKMGLETYVIGDAKDVMGEDSGTIFANLVQGYDLARGL
jgi:2,4-dienoyl-CoA reductase-like NADH-dependent reductase (Old Yellow Enzyme family)